MAKKSKFASRLKKMQSTFAEQREEAEAGYQSLPDGKYKFRITDAELTESSNGNLMAVMECTVLAGEHKGETFQNRQVIEGNEFGFKILCQFIARLGYEVPEDAAEIEDVLAEFAADRPGFLGTLKTKGEYQNLRLNKPLDEDDDDDDLDDDDEAEEAEATESDDGDEEAEEADEEDNVGARVSVVIDGEDYEGEVTADDGDGQLTITFDDGDEDTYDAADVTFLDADESDDEEGDDDEEAEEDGDGETAELSVGDFVEVDGQGEGTVTKIAGNGNLTVKLHPEGRTVRGVSPDSVMMVPEDEIPEDVDGDDDAEGDDAFPVALGDTVNAVWEDGESYPAEVVAIYPDGAGGDPFFTVQSEDGDKWDVKVDDTDAYTID